MDITDLHLFAYLFDHVKFISFSCLTTYRDSHSMHLLYRSHTNLISDTESGTPYQDNRGPGKEQRRDQGFPGPDHEHETGQPTSCHESRYQITAGSF